jgi:hypothetical protein
MRDVAYTTVSSLITWLLITAAMCCHAQNTSATITYEIGVETNLFREPNIMAPMVLVCTGTEYQSPVLPISLQCSIGIGSLFVADPAFVYPLVSAEHGYYVQLRLDGIIRYEHTDVTAMVFGFGWMKPWMDVLPWDYNHGMRRPTINTVNWGKAFFLETGVKNTWEHLLIEIYLRYSLSKVIVWSPHYTLHYTTMGLRTAYTW